MTITRIKSVFQNRVGLCMALVVMGMMAAACTLTTEPPTPTAQPTAIPLILPTTPPLATGGVDTGARLNDSTCALTPANWVSYTVQNGDSLGALSVAVDSSVDELVQNNCLENADSIYVDQVIYLPRLP